MSAQVRDDIAAALDEACACYTGAGNTPGNRSDGKRSRAVFVRKLRRFLQEVPDAITAAELRDELEERNERTG